MKKKIFDAVIILAFLVLLFEILTNKNLVSETISYSLNLWVTSVLPSLFPFFIISDVLISYNITNYIPNIFKKTFTKLFRINDAQLTIFFLSCVSGFPSNARNTRNLYDKGIITKEEASHILMFTHFSNPLFILSTVAVSFLNLESYGIFILISHYLGNFILGLFVRNYSSVSDHYYMTNLEKSQSFSQVFLHAIRSSVDTLLMILGTLTCFLLVSSLMINRLEVGIYSSSILRGILEITMGLKSLSLLPLTDIYKVVIATMFISFGGFSVHLQVISQLVDTDIPYQPFFVARVFHALFSGGICYLLFSIFM